MSNKNTNHNDHKTRACFHFLNCLKSFPSNRTLETGRHNGCLPVGSAAFVSVVVVVVEPFAAAAAAAVVVAVAAEAASSVAATVVAFGLQNHGHLFK